MNSIRRLVNRVRSWCRIKFKPRTRVRGDEPTDINVTCIIDNLSESSLQDESTRKARRRRRTQSAPSQLERMEIEISYSGKFSQVSLDKSVATSGDENHWSSSSFSSDTYSVTHNFKASLSMENLAAKRDGLLDSLVMYELLSEEEATIISDLSDNFFLTGKIDSDEDKPKDGGNFMIRVTDDLKTSVCFLDLMTFGLMDNISDVHFQTLASAFCREKPSTLPEGEMMSEDGSERETGFYSFCLRRVVFPDEFRHCILCHACQQTTFKHCINCHQCSFGLRIGNRCEHCDFKDTGFYDTAQSVASFSELIG